MPFLETILVDNFVRLHGLFKFPSVFHKSSLLQVIIVIGLDLSMFSVATPFSLIISYANETIFVTDNQQQHVRKR